MRRTLRTLADLALTLGALVGVACLVAAVGSVAFGVHPLIFRSGSMAPTIPAGSVAFARDVPAADIRVGDVVSVPWQSSRVTHRVVEVFHRHGSATLKLRGDANSVPDRDLYQVSSAPRVWFSVPWAGSAVAWLSRVPGVFVLAAYAALLLSIVVRRADPGGGTPRARAGASKEPAGRHRHRAAPRAGLGRRRSRAVAAASAVLVIGTATASPTWASWGDVATVSGPTASTYDVPPPTNVACTLTNKELLSNYWHGMRITANVPAPPAGGPAYSYSIQMVRIATPTTVIWTHPLTADGGTVTYNFVDSDITIDQPTQAGVSIDYYVRVVVSLSAATSWNATAQINIDANNSPGILGIIGAGVYYGSPTGTNSPGGQPGRCGQA